MSRKIDMENPDSWDDDDVQYLRDRGLLPEDHPAAGDPTPQEHVALEDRPNTGNANSLGLTQAQFDRAVELLREEEAAAAENSGEVEEDEDEDYDDGWDNDARRAELSSRGLSVDGRKDDLIARLIRSDNDELLPEDSAESGQPA